MNFLAHAFLSFGEPEILVGNMISDFVKGKRQYDYSPAIFTGIRLHRAIDDFTDQHPVTKLAKEAFRPAYRLYASAFIDIVYDHFLANDKEQFQNRKALSLFAGATYASLRKFYDVLPINFQAVLPYMETHNWLLGYREPEGIRRSFAGMVTRSAYMSESATAYAVFEENYHELSEYYHIFFPDLKEFSLNQLRLLQKG